VVAGGATVVAAGFFESPHPASIAVNTSRLAAGSFQSSNSSSCSGSGVR
jgi:hypothetical protein